jgi:Mlc titration factor MtfA (ptsG expression regulator)
VPDALWHTEFSRLTWLHHLPALAQQRLRTLSAHFLAEKEFCGTQGLVVSDAMALSVAMQACLLLLGLQPPQSSPCKALDWYDDFVTVVLHPGAAWAQRRITDAAGVVHQYQEALVGEAMAGGPVMLSWADVDAADTERRAHNVVIHEFVHKMDMRHRPLGEEPSGQPALPARFLGLSASAASAHWQGVMQAAYADFTEQVSAAERFGEPPPWLDTYAATAPAEFFAVTCEAYFVQRARFDADFPALTRLYDGFFDPYGWLHPPLSGAPTRP